MLRSANLRAEVFIDVYDDGSIQADAMLLRVDNRRRLLARGSATFVSADPSGARIDDETVAAWALVDLTKQVLGDAPSPDRTARDAFTATITSDGATPTVARWARRRLAREATPPPCLTGLPDRRRDAGPFRRDHV